MSDRHEGRLRLVLGMAALIFFILLLRTAYLTLICHPELKEQAEDQQTQVVPIPPVRGPILDRAGQVLACNVENQSLVWEGAPSGDLDRLCGELVAAGFCSPERARAIATARPTGFFWLTRRWNATQATRDFAAAHAGVRCEPEMKRFYPRGSIAPQALGIVGTDGGGLSGLEWLHNGWLSGEPGRLLQFVTGAGHLQQTIAPKVLRASRPGGGLILTLDARVQEVVRFRLREGMRRAGASEGFAIVLHPGTGEILALCGEPSFDPLGHEGPALDQLRIRCVTDQLEPGSTFKIVGLAAALESGLVSPDDSVDCMGGVRVIPGGTIHDLKKLNKVTAAEVFIHSSNIGNGLIAEQIGWERLLRMAQAFGFGQATGISLGGEASGSVPHPLRAGWSARSLVTIAYGQEVAVTGLQMALAYAAIANGGWLVKPMIVRAKLDSDGRLFETYEPELVRQVISPETAATMRGLLRRVVTEGTGKAAEVPGLPPGGKTGTAQVYDSEMGRYSPDEHLLSFIGLAPWDDPRCLVQVCLHCEGEHHSGEVAAPIFANIIKDLVWLLEEGAWSSAEISVERAGPVIVPDVRGMKPLAAREALLAAGLLPVLDGLGSRVEELLPQPYASVPRGSVVALTLVGRNQEDLVCVPNVAGLSLRRAVSLLAQGGLTAGVHGSGWIVRQSPERGAAVVPGTLCQIWASPQASQARVESLRRKDLACQTASFAEVASR